VETEAFRPRILVIEDDIFVQGLLSAVLENEGFSSCRAGSAQEALAELDRKSISGILLDLGLPDEEGLSLLRKLRSRTSAPVIVVTANEGLDERLTALEIGAEDFVVKPVEPKELVLRLRRLVRPNQGQEYAPIELHGWRLDLASRVLKNPEGREVPHG
jgi:DNA-binding response OmpR family regulator